MADFVVKLQELEEKIKVEFDIFKNYYRDIYEIDPKNVDTLLFKIKHQIDQIRTNIASQEEDSHRKNESQNSDFLIKSQILTILKELKEIIIGEFHIFKYYNNYDTNQIDLKNLDTILFKVKYHIDKIKNDICGENENDCSELKDVEIKKANALIRLQTLAASVTCHIMNLDNTL